MLVFPSAARGVLWDSKKHPLEVFCLKNVYLNTVRHIAHRVGVVVFGNIAAMRLNAIALGVFLLFGLGHAQGTVYKLRVTEWKCTSSAGVMVARGTVVNQSGQTLNSVRVNLRVVDKVVTTVNGVSNRRVYGTNSAPIAVRSLANGASSRFEVRVKPTQIQGTQCQIWFRSPDIIQIPTRVPGQ